DNLAAILSGSITRWSQLGGQDIPITIFVREDGSDERRLVDETVLSPRGLRLADRVFKVDNNAGIANAMAAFPGAIGITKYRYRAQQRVMKLTDECGIPRTPDAFSINSGSYLMTEAVHVPADGIRQGGEVGELFAALGGPQGPGLIEAAGFVFPEVISSPGAERSALFQRVISLAQNEPETSPVRAAAVNFVEELFSAERLSSTFRFAGNRLDAFGAAELDRLVDYLANAGLSDREILFVGFAGGPEDLPLSLGQSRALAAAVLRRFLDRAPGLNQRPDLGFATLGFGGVAPVGCNALAGGDLLNTRVEVWIRPLS
ncbi:MAG: substrate-binding domain-containing protein, partial [Pseudomonadota bacterium]